MNTLTKNDLLSVLSENKSHISNETYHKNAINYIKDNEFPTSKNEKWKNTNLKNILEHKYLNPKKTKIPQKTIESFEIIKLQANKVVFVNGFYDNSLSNISDNSKIVVCSVTEAKEKHPEIFNKYFNKSDIYKSDIFASFNIAYAQSGVFIYIPDNYIAESPLHVINFTDGDNSKTIVQSHNLIIGGQNSQIKIINTYNSLSANYTFTNIVTEIFLEKDSQINYNTFQGEGNDASQIHNTSVNQNKNSVFNSHTVTFCGTIVKNNFTVNLNEEYAEANLMGLYMPDKEQHFDNFVYINHAKPNCTSNQLFKGIIDNKAKAVFTGKVLVAKNAQKTLSNQSNKNLLLTDYAKVYSRPQLEIYADDVSCSHGSTSGQLDKEALFYLRSRGIPMKRAKTLLMYAFTSDLIKHISIEAYREYINFLINKRLKGEQVTGLCSVKICPSC